MATRETACKIFFIDATDRDRYSRYKIHFTFLKIFLIVTRVTHINFLPSGQARSFIETPSAAQRSALSDNLSEWRSETVI